MTYRPTCLGPSCLRAELSGNLSNPAHGEVSLIQHYVIKFVSDLIQHYVIKFVSDLIQHYVIKFVSDLIQHYVINFVSDLR